MTTARVEAFSDGVFAIAITLLVLTIPRPDPHGDVGHELLHLWPSYGAYGFSVLVIGAIWVNHHAMFGQIELATWPLLFLNTIALGLVAFLPLPTEVLSSALHERHGLNAAAFFYGAPYALFGAITVATWAYARRHALLKASVGVTEARAAERRFLVGPALYAVAAVIGLFAPYVAFVLYAFLVAFFWYPTRRNV